MPIMPIMHLAPDTPTWIRGSIAGLMIVYAVIMLIGAYTILRRK